MDFTASNRRVEVVRFILSENGADINSKNDRRTALNLAACNNRNELVKELLLRCAVYKDRHCSNLTTLQRVARVGYGLIAKCLIEAEANVNAVAKKGGCAAPQAAAGEGHEAAVEILGPM